MQKMPKELRKHSCEVVTSDVSNLSYAATGPSRLQLRGKATRASCCLGKANGARSCLGKATNA